MAARRKQGHDILANEILAMGTTVITEKLSYKAWQKTFGKSVGANAPGSLINTIKRKAENADGELIEINAWKAKLSQYDHELDSYKKKRLSERVHFVGGEIAIQRDLYSAFLALCIDEKENVVSRTTALELWSSIRHLLEAAVIRLSETAEWIGFAVLLRARPAFAQLAVRAVSCLNYLWGGLSVRSLQTQESH